MSHCSPIDTSPSIPPLSSDNKTPLIALAGQPNVGKSTLFNLFTGLNQHVGNWPGKTIERREGIFRVGKFSCRLVDLPGTYSLTANSPEEIIAREFIIKERPDVVIAVVNAASLEHSLYLVSELVTLPAPLVIALNMMDVASQEGLQVEPAVLQAALGVPVVPITARRGAGVEALMQVIEGILNGQITSQPVLPAIRSDHRLVLAEITHHIREFVPSPYPPEWVALKLLEGDAEMIRLMQSTLPAERWKTVYEILRRHDDALLAIASGRYEWIGRMVRAAVVQPALGQIGWTQRLDQWATHPFWGLVILAGILGLVFWLTFTIGTPIQKWLEMQVISPMVSLTSQVLANAPFWVRGLMVDGMLGGAGAVITFLPIMMIFFAVFALLEDTGYMARAAYVMDNTMHTMGLHGKSFLPLFLGFGCNVPAVLGTRVIDSWPARLLTILLAPFVPCTARMAVVAFLAAAFFGSHALLISWSLVLISLSTLILSGVVLNRLIFKGQRSAFIMEMPLYHIPHLRTIALLVWQHSLAFLKKAGTNILAISVVVWALSVLPAGDLSTSYLTQFGKALEPVGRWMGLDWRLTVALITSFPAKENAIATLGVLFGADPAAGLGQQLVATFSPASALSFLVVTMLFIPCMATVAVIRQETHSWRWTLFSLTMFLLISFVAGSIVYHLAVWAGL